MTNSFLDARDSRAISINQRVIVEEIQAIELAIMDAREANATTCTVGPGTTPTPIVTDLTSSETAFEAWSDPRTNDTDEHRVARYQMDKVIANFVRLNYTVVRRQNDTDEAFNWIITW